MNGDGIEDLLFGDRAGYIQYYSRVSSSNLNYEGRIKADGSDMYLDLQASSPCVTDWNEDGLLDIIVGAGIWKTKIPLRLYLNNGSKSSYQYDKYEYIFYGNDTIKATYPQIEVTDLDGDGIKDLLLQDCFYDSWLGGDTTNLFFFKNYGSNSNPLFNTRDTVKYNGIPIKSKLAKLDTKDLNEDGTTDIIVSGTGRDITIYFNDHPVPTNKLNSKSLSQLSFKRRYNNITLYGDGLVSWRTYSLSGKTINRGILNRSLAQQTINIPNTKNIKILSIESANKLIRKIKIF